MSRSKERLYHLDLIRFVAALYVVFYHYGFRGFNADNMSNLQLGEIEFFSKYGYLGVDLFFIISGFVILMSAMNSNIVSFIISRISRLYPAYWICIVLTAVVMLFWGGTQYSVTPYVFLSNLTMLNGFFNIEYVDGVYWSLLVELKFYILIGALLLLRKLKYLEPVIYVWLAISIYFLIASQTTQWNVVLSVINFFLIPTWCSYFVAGMLFFLILKDGNIKTRIFPLSICLGLSLAYSTVKLEILTERFGDVFSPEVVYLLIIGFYILFFLISIKKLGIFNKPIYLKVGMLTYPLYLLHQNIGYIIFNNLKGSVNRYLLFALVITLMVYCSYIISSKLEKPMRLGIKNKLEKSYWLRKARLYLKAENTKQIS
ncbi:acyltransferase [Flagellimonas halotolerans]|uniref:Acyltransferase n=1 Tax=Flagellimonas halotolerans TaxID=3112164 RepID=A0ABU6ISP1_9FLAO|nr:MULTISPECIES: acyltransferase [unclassified Allomuricauda]MEC3966161.1 acyltransferase [Muricauda sp. SYSU M86414]MEC4266026.1 acyltransferase [Muricauda sp. SYSU M84420]